VATQHFIRQKDYSETLRIAEMLLGDEEDLIHKAVGWMLREVGKRDRALLESFLRKNWRIMPRTTLRYAIERFAEEDRKAYLHGTFRI
jgi:3-methyladenine DNA glycosylase AlkD